MKMKEKYSIPYIVAVRDSDINVFLKYLVHFRPLGFKILMNADKVIFLSEPYKKMLLNKYEPTRQMENISTKSLTMPNGIDKFWFEHKGKPKQGLRNELRLLCIGVVNKRKHRNNN